MSDTRDGKILPGGEHQSHHSRDRRRPVSEGNQQNRSVRCHSRWSSDSRIPVLACPSGSTRFSRKGSESKHLRRVESHNLCSKASALLLLQASTTGIHKVNKSLCRCSNKTLSTALGGAVVLCPLHDAILSMLTGRGKKPQCSAAPTAVPGSTLPKVPFPARTGLSEMLTVFSVCGRYHGTCRHWKELKTFIKSIHFPRGWLSCQFTVALATAAFLS